MNFRPVSGCYLNDIRIRGFRFIFTITPTKALFLSISSKPKRILRSLLSTLAAAACLAASAQDKPSSPSRQETSMEKVVITRYLSDGTVTTDTITSPGEIIVKTDSDIFPLSGKRTAAIKAPKLPEHLRTVMVGLELSTGLDLSGTDMSTFNGDILFGYRNKFIQLLGASIGVHKSLGTSDCFLPIQAVFRTGFHPRPTLCFMHVSAGYSFNTIARSPLFGDFIATAGVGVNLVQKRSFQSNIVLAFGFRHLNDRHQEISGITKSNLGFTQISFGISM